MLCFPELNIRGAHEAIWGHLEPELDLVLQLIQIGFNQKGPYARRQGTNWARGPCLCTPRTCSLLRTVASGVLRGTQMSSLRVVVSLSPQLGGEKHASGRALGLGLSSAMLQGGSLPLEVLFRTSWKHLDKF